MYGHSARQQIVHLPAPCPPSPTSTGTWTKALHHTCMHVCARTHTHPHPHPLVLPPSPSPESEGQWATPCVDSTARHSALMPHPASPPPPHQCTYEVQEGALHHTCYHSFLLPPRLAQQQHTYTCTRLYTHAGLCIYVYADTRMLYIYVFALSLSLCLSRSPYFSFFSTHCLFYVFFLVHSFFPLFLYSDFDFFSIGDVSSHNLSLSYLHNICTHIHIHTYKSTYEFKYVHVHTLKHMNMYTHI